MQTLLVGPVPLLLWFALTVPSAVWVIRDITVRNAHLMPLMKVVWVLTVIYSGPLGLLIYLYSGRKEISRDTLARRAFRSVAHCYSGCGLGEILGVLLAVGLFALGNLWASVITFALAYLFGFALTVGPLVQGGVALPTALKDAVLSETPSITVMEVVAIGVALVITHGATMSDPLFWTGLVVSLTCGLVAAYPVNVALLHWGVKEGMMDPRMTEHGHGAS